MPSEDEIARLKSELRAEIKAELGAELAAISARLDALERSVATVGHAAEADTLPRPGLASREGDGGESRAPITEFGDGQARPQARVTQDEMLDDPWAAQPSKAGSGDPGNRQLFRESRKGLFAVMAGGLGESLGQLGAAALGPLAGMFTQLQGFYRHYQAKGMGPVFLMTLAGIIAMTLGFGYLLQYSINHWLSELGKALAGMVAANAILVGGMAIRRRRPEMADFGSGIVGLGLILNYLCVYFLGPYFGLVPESVTLVLLLLVSLGGYGLSFRLEARVIAIVALFGGSLSPLLLLEASQAPLLYLPYLLLLGVCSLAQSRRLAWPVLMEITCVLHMGCVQLLSGYLALPLFAPDWQGVLALSSLNALFYLYGIGSLVLLGSAGFTARLLALPVALLAFVIYSLGEFSAHGGQLFVVNALICSCLYAYGLFGSRQSLLALDRRIRGLLLAFGGAFAGFAALYLLSSDLLALVLLLEGVLLLWLGCREAEVTVRAEAYVLLLGALVTQVMGLGESVFQGGAQETLSARWQLLGVSWLGLLLSSLAFFICVRLMQRQEQGLLAIERRLLRVFHEGLSLLYLASLLLGGYLLSPTFCLNALPAIGLLLLYLSARDKLAFTEVLAWLLMLPLLALVLFGMLEAQDLSFGAQSLNVKLARVELFLSLLLAYYWYRGHYPQARLVRLAYRVQLLCFMLLPLLLLPKVLRSFPEYLAIALWLSAFMGLGLARFVGHRYLAQEVRVLTVLAFMVTATSCLVELWQGLLALGIGAGFMLLLVLRYPAFSAQWQSLLILQWRLAPFYFALVVAVLANSLAQALGAGELGAWGIAALALCGYFAAILEPSTVPGRVMKRALRPGFSIAYGMLFACVLMPLLLQLPFILGLGGSLLVVNLAGAGALWILGRYLLVPRLAVRWHRDRVPPLWLHWGWHILLALSYVLWSQQLAPSLAATVSAILLASHGGVLMFVSLRPGQGSMVRLAAALFGITCLKVLLLDMASFALLHKVAAFMMIGLILLGVAYFYQLARNRRVSQV